MADSTNTHETKLTSSANTTGATQMGGALEQIGLTAETVKTQVEELMATFVALFAMAELISFFKDATAEAEKLEVAMRGVDFAAGSMNVSVPELREKVMTFSEALSKLGGVMDNEIVAAMSALLVKTGNYEEAAARATLAMKIHTNTGLDYATALTVVDAATRGMARGMKVVTNEFFAGATAQEKAANMVAYLNERFGKLTVGLHDNAGELEKSRARWDNFKDEIGKVTLALTSGVIKAIHEIPEDLRYMAALGGELFKQLGERVGLTATFIKDIFAKGWAEASKIHDAELAKIVATDKTREAEIQRNHETAAAREIALLEKTISKELGLRVHAAKEQQTIKHSFTVWSEAELRAEENWQYASWKRQHDAETNVYVQRLKDLKKWIHDKQALNKAADAEEYRELEQSVKQQEDLQFAQFKTYQKLKQQELNLEADVLNGGLDLAGQAFGAQKEIAMAQALIRAVLAVISALSAPWPLDLILPILIAAAAAEQIAQISSQSAPAIQGITGKELGGAGFDDPSNDAAAYAGGRKWASDMIGKFTGGASSVSQGWAHGMGATNNNSTSNVTNIINVSGMVTPNDKETLKQLGRKLAVVMQADGQRTVARK